MKYIFIKTLLRMFYEALVKPAENVLFNGGKKC